MQNYNFKENVYTDLAMEAREMDPGLSGVREEAEQGDGFSISRISIDTEEAAKRLGKATGRYIALDAPELVNRPLDLFALLSQQLSKELQSLFSPLPEEASVLAVGLGNRAVTPDALGPRIVEQLYVTRHIREYLPDVFTGPVRSLSALSPGVLGVTGVETMEIVRGVVEHVKPDLILVFDSLASRRASRISTTIQITDSGISPGAGVGNYRMGLTKDSFRIPVIAIGVPMVVYASTIAQDTIGLIAEETGLHGDEGTLKELAEKLVKEHMDGLIVTPKDVDAILTDMSRILADGVNLALFGSRYEEVRNLLA